MSIPEQTVKEMKRIMIVTSLQSVGITAAIIIITLIVSTIFKFHSNVNSLTVTVLIVGALMAVIGNNFVSNAVTRFDAKDTILWRWGNKVQAIGFILTLVAAFL